MKRKSNSISRRKAIGLLGSTGAGILVGSLSGVSQASAEGGGKPLSVAGQSVALQIASLNSRTLRISLLPVIQGKTAQIGQSPVLVRTNWPAPLASLHSARSKTIAWNDMRLNLSSDPLCVSVETRAGKKIQQLEIDTTSAAVHFPLSGRPIFGLGEGGKQFDRRGAAYPMKHGEGVPDLATDGARLPIPWLVGTEGWAAFFHRPLGTFDLAGKNGVFQARSGQPALPLDIFLVVSATPAEIMREYALLTGFPHMPPIWSLGYQQSHRTISSRKEVMSELETFRDKELPCDVMIYLGTGFCPSGWNLGHGSYQFNPKAFPDPGPMIAKMHEEHFRIVLHEDKPPAKLFGSVTDTGAAASDPDDAAYYWKEHLKVFDMGIDGWWADEGDWLSDVGCLIRNRMYWQGSIQARPDVRPYTLNRNGYAGVQRYGWVWSGDIRSTWETLKDQIKVGLNAGLSGIPFWGTDTGGFLTTPQLTGELYVRWFQFSAFCSLFRSHGRTWKLRLPWGWDTGSYGPIENPVTSLPPRRDLHNPLVEPICRKYLDLRYKLMPYLYSCIREAHETGLPLMRALWLHYPDDPNAVERSDEYLFGPDLLVAPVTEKGAETRTLYLPPGTWYDFWTEKVLRGGREITRQVDLETIPLYVRAGSMLPLGPVRQYATEVVRAPVTLTVYPGSDGHFSLYEDDGISFDYEKGAYAQIDFAWNDNRRELSASIANRSSWAEARDKNFEVRLAGTKAIQKLFLKRGAKVVHL